MPRSTNPVARPLAAGPLTEVLLALGCAALALWVHRGALGVYFHPDDLISLERARGILPTPDLGPWRLLSGPVYFSVMVHVFGTRAAAYHLLNAALHAANVVLLYALVRRWGGTALAATLAAGLFGAARPAFSVLQQAVGIGELLAFGLALGAMLLVEQAPAWKRGAAVGLMLAALMSKEGVLLLPLVLLVPREAAGAVPRVTWRQRLRRAAPLLATSGAVAVALTIWRVPQRAFAGEAYATAFGPNLFHNAMTYLAWACDILNPFYDEPANASAQAWRVGVPVALALLALAWLTRRRTRLPLAGLAWAVLAIAPVVPLVRHTYANYLYVPIAGLTLALGAGFGALATPVRASGRPGAGTKGARHAARPWRGRFLAPAIAAVALFAYAAAGSGLLERRQAARLPDVDLPLDPQLRKSEIVDRSVQGLLRAGTPPRRIAIYMPSEFIARADTRTGTFQQDSTLSFEHTWVYLVLDGGSALRALIPGLDSVAFVPRWTANYADFDLCIANRMGGLVDFGRGPDAHLELAGQLLQGRFAGLAAEHLEQACVAFPQDPRLPQALAIAREAAAKR